MQILLSKKIGWDVTAQPGLRIYCADRTKTERPDAVAALPKAEL